VGQAGHVGGDTAVVGDATIATVGGECAEMSDNNQMEFRIGIHNVSFIEKPDRQDDFDWELFNTGFVNREVDIFEFFNYIYIGRSYCAWMNGKRKVDNFQLAQHIAVDIDTGDKRGTIAELQKHPLVQGYGAIIHETPSHRPDAPRARVIFLLDEPITTADGYKAAIQVVTEMFDGADPACVDAARFFFGNGKLGFHEHRDGIWMRPDACLPVSELRRMARLRVQKQKEQRTQNNQPTPNVQPSDEVISLVEMEERLRSLNPYSIDYTEWAKVVAALGHVYGSGAFIVAKNWSDKPGKDPLTEKKWRSLIGEHPKAAGYGTLMRALKEFAR